MSGRVGGCNETFSGIQFYPLDPRPEDIKLVDIAHALSNICRFTGHSSEYYSVGQHSLAIADYLRKHDYSPRLQLIGLLHDACEAYLCDIPSPIKPLVQGYKEWENRILEMVWEAFNIEPPTVGEWWLIKRLDQMALASEGSILMKNTSGWIERLFDGQESIEVIFNLNRTPALVKQRFIQRAELLSAQLRKGD